MTGGLISRRRFLAGIGAAGAAGLAAGLWTTDPWATQAASAGAESARPGTLGPLVLVTLYGGNDGLNTVIPYENGSYHSARPTLGYSGSEVLALGDGLALNPKLAGLHGLWGQGRLAIVRGVGYPNPSLSHFGSMDIWQTGNPDGGTGTGWLGRWLDATGDDPMRAISVGTTLPPALVGAKTAATAVNAETIRLPGDAGLQSAFAALSQPGPDRTGVASLVAAASSELLEAKASLDRLSPAAPNSPSTAAGSGSAGRGGGTGGSLSEQLQIVAGLVSAGAPTRVYQVSLSSFDTHADEKANHERLLQELDTAVTAFLKSVEASPHGSGVVVMTYSEFGRRLAQNASGGTDHGTAAPLFVAGPAVRGGQFYGEDPSLGDLDPNGNLLHTVDFRSVYATVLERVVGADPAQVLGGSFPLIDLV